MEPDAPNDAELVARTLAGDREAFGRLYDRHARLVRAVAAGVLGDWAGVEDMVQECFLRGYRSLARLRDPERFGAWIAGIARQVTRERRRSLRRDRHEFGGAQPAETSAPGGAEIAIEREELDLVIRRLARLPERERLAIHAFYFEGQDARQAAERLGLSRSGFYALLQRAIARLAAEVEPCQTREGEKS